MLIYSWFDYKQSTGWFTVPYIYDYDFMFVTRRITKMQAVSLGLILMSTWHPRLFVTKCSLDKTDYQYYRMLWQWPIVQIFRNNILVFMLDITLLEYNLLVKQALRDCLHWCFLEFWQELAEFVEEDSPSPGCRGWRSSDTCSSVRPSSSFLLLLLDNVVFFWIGWTAIEK